MSIEINGQMYYRTLDVCKEAGISRATLLRWLKESILEDVMSRDRKGWRLFTEEDLNKIRAEATRIKIGEKP